MLAIKYINLFHFMSKSWFMHSFAVSWKFFKICMQSSKDEKKENCVNFHLEFLYIYRSWFHALYVLVTTLLIVDVLYGLLSFPFCSMASPLAVFCFLSIFLYSFLLICILYYLLLIKYHFITDLLVTMEEHVVFYMSHAEHVYN